MDEIRELTDVEKRHYSIQIYSDRLLNLMTDCSEDGAWSQATGNMYFLRITSEWVVEYLCPKDRELFRKWTRETDATTKQIAKDVLGDENKADE